MDFSGLIWLIVLIIIGGSLYLATRNIGIVARKPDLPEEGNETSRRDPDKTLARNLYDTSTEDLLETSEDIFPIIEFPPEPEKEFIPELPESYGETKISLMARDPKTLYAYWEVPDLKKKELGNKWNQSVPVIRIYDVTGLDYLDETTARPYHDEFINDYANSWYITVHHCNRVYCADLGRIFSDGSFFMIARSNFTFTPPNALSDKVDPEWMLVTEHQKKLYSRIGHGDGNSSYNLFDW